MLRVLLIVGLLLQPMVVAPAPMPAGEPCRAAPSSGDCCQPVVAATCCGGQQAALEASRASHECRCGVHPAGPADHEPIPNPRSGDQPARMLLFGQPAPITAMAQVAEPAWPIREAATTAERGRGVGLLASQCSWQI